MRDRARLLVPGAVLIAMTAGCITVNVYFPVKELRQAAEEIVDEVRPDIVGVQKPGSGGSNDGGDRGDSGDSRQEPDPLPALESRADGARGYVSSLPAASRLLPVSLVRTGEREEEEENESGDNEVINASSPKIKKIKASLKARYRKLLPLYVRGRVGEGLDGYLAVREVKDLGLKERHEVSTLVKAENVDRRNLYQAIAEENRIDASKIKDIGVIFAKAWQKSSKTGWWIEVKKGKWVKKPKPKKPEKGDKPEESEKPAGAD